MAFLTGGRRAVTGGTKQSKVLKVEPGLFVLRYLGGPEARTAPRAVVNPSPRSSVDIDVIAPPGAVPGHMDGPGSSLVLVARRPGHLDITIEAVEGSISLDAKFSLDLLAAAQGAERPEVAAGPVGDAAPSLALGGHVSRRGDIAADDAGWLAGPRTPSPIEGVEIRCSGGNVGVSAQFTNTLDPSRWSAWQTPGSLAGTRRRASSLTGLRLKLVGADAFRFDIEGEALFLGSPVMAQRGAEIEFTSQAGLDPLVGLRLALVGRGRSDPGLPAQHPRVRVFR